MVAGEVVPVAGEWDQDDTDLHGAQMRAQQEADEAEEADRPYSERHDVYVELPDGTVKRASELTEAEQLGSRPWTGEPPG